MIIGLSCPLFCQCVVGLLRGIESWIHIILSIGVLPICVSYMICIQCIQKTEQGGDLRELEVCMVVSHHVDAGDGARSFGKAASDFN